jgi:hypothetical protein
MVNPVAHMNGNRFLADHFSSSIACRRQRGEGRDLGSWICVVPIRGDMKIKREGVPGNGKGRKEAEGAEGFASEVET